MKVTIPKKIVSYDHINITGNNNLMLLENKSKHNYSSLNITKTNKIKNTKIDNNINQILIYNYKKKIITCKI